MPTPDTATPRTPPSPKPRLILGHTFDYLGNQIAFLERCVRDHGDVVKLKLGNLDTVLLTHPEHIEFVLRAHPENFIKDRLTRWLIPLVGEGLLTSEGETWRRNRKLAQPGFQRQQIERYATEMVDQTTQMLDTWHEGQVRDPHQDFMRLTLAIVAKTLMGAEISGDATIIGESLEVVMNHFMSPRRWFKFFDYLPIPSTKRYWHAIKQIDQIIYRIIEDRRQSGVDSGDLLSRLLAARDEDNQGLTDRQLRDEIITLVLAGHETTALVLFFTFWLLSQNPAVEQKLSQELDQVLGPRPPTASDVPSLRYCEWIIRESMRLYPPAWGIAREALDDCEIGGYHIPKGTQLFLTQWLVHRDPRWFENPQSFHPERWDNDLIKRLPRCTYFPFGDGPRVCIGNHFAMMEAILLLATIAQRYRLTPDPAARLELLPSITMRPKSVLTMRVTNTLPTPTGVEAMIR